MVKSLPARWETRVRSLGQEDPLKKEMAPHSSILAWKSPWMGEPGGLQSMGSQSQTQLSNFTLFESTLKKQNILCIAVLRNLAMRVRVEGPVDYHKWAEPTIGS